MSHSYSAKSTRTSLMFMMLFIFICSLAVARPNLVIVLVNDQFRYDYLTRYENQLTGGLKTISTKGTFYTNAHLNYGTSHTGVGHATIGTGQSPDEHGIVANYWYDRNAKKSVYCAEDSRYPVLTRLQEAEAEGRKLTPADLSSGRSPKKLQVTTLADSLRISNNFHSRAYSLSFKDRSAILMGGNLPNASIWYDSKSGKFTSSTYYGKTLPDWVSSFNEKYPVDQYYGLKWTLLFDEKNYQLSHPERTAEETGFGVPFPVTLTSASGKPDSQFYAQFAGTPYANDHLFELAKFCIRYEKLGKNTTPDLLMVSFSPTDVIGHAYGPFGKAMQDAVMRYDMALSDFLKFVDTEVGLNNTLIVYTADHGAPPMPGFMAQYDLGGGVSGQTVINTINETVKTTYNIDSVVLSLNQPYIYLDIQKIKDKKLNVDEVLETASSAAESVQGISKAYVVNRLLHNQYPDSDKVQLIQHSIFPRNSGDLYLQLRPYWAFGNYDKGGTEHGSPYPYDTHITIIFYGNGIQQSIRTEPVNMEDIAPSIAYLLGVEMGTQRTHSLLPGLIK